jgi:hypothetical protein
MKPVSLCSSFFCFCAYPNENIQSAQSSYYLVGHSISSPSINAIGPAPNRAGNSSEPFATSAQAGAEASGQQLTRMGCRNIHHGKHKHLCFMGMGDYWYLPDAAA